MQNIPGVANTVDRSLFVATRVEKNWLTDSYEVNWAVLEESGDVHRRIATGQEVFGPLWAPEQVERLVSALCDRLRGLDWSDVIDSLDSHPANGLREV